ncbi:uncharacterized protein NPIL_2291, partial [Nephila pilipes]
MYSPVSWINPTPTRPTARKVIAIVFNASGALSTDNWNVLPAEWYNDIFNPGAVYHLYYYARDVPKLFGMLVFYILSGGKHPFGSSDQECQMNIKQGQPTMGSHPEDTEARDLVNETIKGDASARPTIEMISKHPYFWDINKRFQFLLQVGRKITFYT